MIGWLTNANHYKTAVSRPAKLMLLNYQHERKKFFFIGANPFNTHHINDRSELPISCIVRQISFLSKFRKTIKALFPNIFKSNIFRIKGLPISHPYYFQLKLKLDPYLPIWAITKQIGNSYMAYFQTQPLFYNWI